MTRGTESLIRLGILMTALTVILWTNAEDFDITEIKALALFFLGSSSLEGATGLYMSNRDKRNSSAD